MENAVITVKDLMYFMAFVASLAGFAAIVYKLFSPWRKLEEKVENLAKEVNEIKEEQEKMKENQNKVDSTLNLLLRGMNAIIEHEQNGASLEPISEEFKDYLLPKK